MPCLPAGRKAAGSKATVVGAGLRACPGVDHSPAPTYGSDHDIHQAARYINHIAYRFV